MASAAVQHDEAADTDARPLALVFRTNLLPLSETFIRNQVLALKRWRAMLIGLQYAGGLELSQLHCQLLSTYKMRPIPSLLRAALRELNLPPPGVRRYLQNLHAAVAHVHFGTDLVARRIGHQRLIDHADSFVTRRRTGHQHVGSRARSRMQPIRFAYVHGGARIAVRSRLRENGPANRAA